MFFGTYYIHKSISFKVPIDKHILILGDSTTECAIDDNIFSNSVNMSYASSLNLFSYLKLEKFLDVNSHVDKVVLSFHCFGIKKEIDEKINDAAYIKNNIPRHLFLFKKNEILLFGKNSYFFKAVFKSLIFSTERLLKLLKNKDLIYSDLRIGGYYKIDNIINDMNNNIAFNNLYIEDKFEYSQYELEYLLKIVKLCKDKNVELILLSTPFYNKYYDKSGITYFYNTYLSDIKYFDFSDFYIPEYGYADVLHLNYRGAEIFSHYLEDNYKNIFND